jgi:putative membrane protein
MASPLNDMVLVFRRLFAFVKYLGFLFFAMTLIVIGREVSSMYEWVDGYSPPLAWAFLVLVLFLAFRLIGVPVYRFLKMPVVLRAPKLPGASDEARWGTEECRVWIEYLRKYLKLLRRNPELTDSLAKVHVAEDTASALADHIADQDDPKAAREEIARFEREHVTPLLEPLDREVDRLIRAEALSVGAATALSPNGTLDAFIVLWRNGNLVSRIANIYYGRPGVRGSLKVLRDVSGAALLASYLDGLSEAAGGLIGGVLGSVAGVLAGPLVDGGINAIATLRIGYLAKERCRSFKGWDEAAKRNALTAALAAAKDRSQEVIAGIGKAAGGAVKGGLAGLVRKVKGEGSGEAVAGGQ